MNVSTGAKRAEAIIRMRMLDILPQTIKQFEQKNKISRSDPPFGAFYWVEGEDLAYIRSFEEEHNAIVYLVVRSYTEFGVMDCFLFVSDHDEEWESDYEGCREPWNGVFAYVYNRDNTDCSEFGYIGIARTEAAGLVRIW